MRTERVFRCESKDICASGYGTPRSNRLPVARTEEKRHRSTLDEAERRYLELLKNAWKRQIPLPLDGVDLPSEPSELDQAEERWRKRQQNR